MIVTCGRLSVLVAAGWLSPICWYWATDSATLETETETETETEAKNVVGKTNVCRAHWLPLESKASRSTAVQVLQNELHSELSFLLPGEDCHDRCCPS